MFVVIFFSEWSGLAAEGEAKLQTSLNTEKYAEPLPYKTAGYLATVHLSRKVGAADSYDRIDIGCKDDVSHAAVAPAIKTCVHHKSIGSDNDILCGKRLRTLATFSSSRRVPEVAIRVDNDNDVGVSGLTFSVRSAATAITTKLQNQQQQQLIFPVLLQA